MKRNSLYFYRIFRSVLCVSLCLVIGAVPSVAAASGMPDCRSQGCMDANMHGRHASSESAASGVTHGCCTGSPKPSCDLEKSVNFDDSNFIVSISRPHVPETAFCTVLPHDDFSGAFGFGVSESLRNSRASPGSAPIYLHNLVILC